MMWDDEACLPWDMTLVAWLVLVESEDEVVGEEAAGGSEDVWIKQRDAADGEWLRCNRT